MLQTEGFAHASCHLALLQHRGFWALFMNFGIGYLGIWAVRFFGGNFFLFPMKTVHNLKPFGIYISQNYIVLALFLVNTVASYLFKCLVEKNEIILKILLNKLNLISNGLKYLQIEFMSDCITLYHATT